MSALGHEQTSRNVRGMSVIALKADIHQRGLHVRLVPEADIPCALVGARIAAGYDSTAGRVRRRSARNRDIPSVDPTFLRSRGVGHLHPAIFARHNAEFGALCHHADYTR
jgi:hypothetical protein